MKYAHISLVALAAMAIAGCGGGSDNGNNGKGDVTDTEKLLGGLAFRLSSGTTIKNGQSRIIDQRNIKCDGPGDCALKVTGNATDGYELTSTGGTITVTLVPQQTTRDGTDNSAAVTEANRERDAANRRAAEEERKRKEAEQELATEQQQGNLRVRAPKLVAALNATFGPLATTVTREDRGSPKVSFSSIGNYEGPTNPPSVPGSWSGVRYTYDGTVHEDTVTIYTNIGSPNQREFWKIHGLAADGLTITVSNGEATYTPENGQAETIQIGGTSAALYAANGAAITDTNEAVGARVSATYAGTGGWLICTDCTAAVSLPNRKIPADDSGTWVFRPRSITALHNRSQDETYLQFGLWASHPEDEGDDYRSPAFQWIASGGSQTIDASAVALKGPAKFVGGAVGEYSIDKVGDRDAKAGSFTAATELRADFGAEGANTHTISGKIHDFKENGSSLGWGTLSLVGNLNDPATTVNIGSAGIAGGLTIEGTAVTGSWQANLYGVTNEDVAKPQGAKCQNTGCAAELAGVAGRFDASGGIVAGGGNTDSDVAIVGAFGAAYTGQ